MFQLYTSEIGCPKKWKNPRSVTYDNLISMLEHCIWTPGLKSLSVPYNKFTKDSTNDKYIMIKSMSVSKQDHALIRLVYDSLLFREIFFIGKGKKNYRFITYNKRLLGLLTLLFC